MYAFLFVPNTVNKELLWKALGKFSCSSQFLAILREFRDCMKAQVVVLK